MAAAAACWINTDDSQAQGVVLGWQGVRVFDCKGSAHAGCEAPALAPLSWDFAWCPLTSPKGFSAWLPVP